MARFAMNVGQLVVQLSPLEKLGAWHGDVRVPVSVTATGQHVRSGLGCRHERGESRERKARLGGGKPTLRVGAAAIALNRARR